MGGASGNGIDVAWRLAVDLAAARAEGDVAAAAARAAGVLCDAGWARVWVFDRADGYRLAGGWPEGEARVDPPPGIARAVATGDRVLDVTDGSQASRIVVPLRAGAVARGAIELGETGRPGGRFTDADGRRLRDLLGATEEALASARANARAELGRLEAIHRLTRLFDLGKSLASTWDAREIAQVVVTRAVAAFQIEGAYFWRPRGERLAVVAARGPGADAVLGWEVGGDEGIAGAATAGPVLVDDAEVIDELDRPDARAGIGIRSVAAVPVLSPEGELHGVVEAVNVKGREALLSDADVRILGEIAASAAIAFGNAARLDGERKATSLSALLDVAQELGSQLDTGKQAFTLVHRAATVLSYSRASVGLFARGRFEVAAISGETFVDRTHAGTRELSDLLEWAASLDEGLYVVRAGDGRVDTPRPETREKLRVHFERSGMRTFLAIPLADDDGPLGVFALEADAPYAFSARDMEIATLLSAQATVALRSSMLHAALPFARVLAPLSKRSDALRATSWRPRAMGAVALAIACALLFVPVPLWIGGRATVAPAHRVAVTAAQAGRLSRVLVAEGSRVEAGQVVAVCDDAEMEASRADAEARYRAALRDETRLRAAGFTGEAAARAAEIDGLRADLDLWDERLAATRLRSPVAGVIGTPRPADLEGASLAPGDVLCEVVEAGDLVVEVAVPEADAALLASGQAVRVKLHAHPTEVLDGTVARVGVTATPVDGERVVRARVALRPSPLEVRPGMTGRAKLLAGPVPLGRALFRRPARAIWSFVWSWLP